MRLSRNHVDYLAFLVLKSLKDNPRIELRNPDKAVGIVRQQLLENMRQEQELQREVEELLKKHRREILESDADYRRLVAEGVKKLARQKGFVI